MLSYVLNKVQKCRRQKQRSGRQREEENAGGCVGFCLERDGSQCRAVSRGGRADQGFKEITLAFVLRTGHEELSDVGRSVRRLLEKSRQEKMVAQSRI